MKNASVEKIKSVVAHPNADRLDLVEILGYQCVTERGLHYAHDLIIYIQPDSVFPENTKWAEGYRKYSPGRIKAVKLRGEWSEGVILPMKDFLDAINKIYTIEDFPEGTDVSTLLGITHYEPPLPQDLSAKGLIPFGIPKTDEERWENMVGTLPFGETVDVTLKIDGQSWTAYYNLESETFGVCGRTLEFKSDAHNKYTAHVQKYGIREKLTAYCKEHGVSLALRGESYGQGIQAFDANPHSKENSGLALFSVYNIKERKYARKGNAFYFPIVANALSIPHVPILEENVVLTQTLIDKYSTGLKKIDGKAFEGVVINHGTNSFKVINKNYDTNK